MNRPFEPSQALASMSLDSSARDESGAHSTTLQRRLDPRWSTFVVFTIIGLIFSITPIVNTFRHPPEAERNKDYSLWYVIGEDVQQGDNLYEIGPNNEVRYMYPPTLAVLVFAPLSKLGWTGFVIALNALNILALVACVFVATLLVAGRWSGLPRTVYWLPAFCVGPYIWDLFLLGQANLFLLLLFMLSILALRNGREWLSGSLLGMAVAIKVFPLPAIVYLAARGSWRAVLSTILVCLLCVYFIPGIVRGFERNRTELVQWFGLMIGDQSGSTMAARSATGFSRRNQSIISLSHRLLRPVDAGLENGVKFRVNIASVSPGTAQKVGYAICFGLGAVLLFVTRLRFARTVEQEGMEVGMVCALVSLCSPLAWTYFYCWLLPAWTALLYYLLTSQQSRGIRRVAWCGGILSGLLLASAMTENYDETLQAYGVTTWGAMGLYLTLAWIRYWATIPSQYVGRVTS